MSMMTDSSQFQPYLAQLPSYPEYPTEISDIFDTELYNNSFAIANSGPGSHSESRGSSPQNLLTPPNDPLPNFPEIHDGESGMNSLFQLFDDDMKGLDMPTSTSSFLPSIGAGFGPASGFGMSMGLGGYGITNESLSAMSLSMPSAIPETAAQGIDPQLVDTPSAVSDNGDDEEHEESEEPPVPSPTESEKLTLTIAPLKAMRGRKGTVHSGGVVKKSASSPLSREKENTAIQQAIASKRLPIKTKPAPSPPAPLTSAPGPFLTESPSVAESDAGDNDDDLPQDWRPSPEVFAKMTSKEKRQLRNKISARNFRVRRKEYISTLEGDIAERDRLLDHFKMQLGSQESENLALRQEIAALKKALLEGRGGAVNLPPPAPLPEQSAAEVLAANASAAAAQSHPTSPLLTANTQKDLPTSPRLGNRFWGGVGMGGGITPVHTALVPDISAIVRKGLQENMNPAMNARVGLDNQTNMPQKPALHGFDGFADMNPFTMKTLDAYRMHLWTKMASQHQTQQTPTAAAQPTNNVPGMRPHFLLSPSRTNLPSTLASSGTLSALLSGKTASSSLSATSSYPSPPTTPQLHTKTITSPKERELQVQREKEQHQAMLAAVASQTIFGKLGGAFWEAFTGSSTSASSSSNLDADKVKRVLEGKAVLRVVDLEPVTPPVTPKSRPAAVSSRPSIMPAGQEKDKCMAAFTDILEESMRSLTLGKKL